MEAPQSVQTPSVNTIARFAYSAAVLLFLTGLFKAMSTFQGSAYLNLRHPIFPISNSSFYLSLGIFEMGLAYFLTRRDVLRMTVPTLVILSIVFCACRVSVHLMHFKESCYSLGNAVEWFGIKPDVGDLIAKGILFYLLLGSSWLMIPIRSGRYSTGR